LEHDVPKAERAPSLADAQPPTGAARRRTRISDAETGRRMLAAAVAMISERGLSVSLEHLSLEEVIHAAGVARTSVYRRWPYKDLFFGDLLVELAEAAVLGRGYGSMPAVIETYLAGELERPAGVAPEQDRRDFFVELLRVISLADFEAVSESEQWRTYIALHATHLGLPDGDLRRRVGESLARSEQRLTESRAAVFGRLAPLAGFRLVGGPTDQEEGFRLLSLAAGSVTTGLVVKAFADPSLVRDRRSLAPFGTSREAEWSDSGLVQVGVVLSHLEPDPDASWDGGSVRRLAAGVRALAAEDARGT
jgi:AcrR family transcriptional regulator